MTAFYSLQESSSKDLSDWKSALQAVAGVYVITDTHTGKLYVGSAYGGEGIRGRRRSYVETCHGGNKELRALFKTDAEVLIGYESRWKDWLGTRLNGYNSN